MVSPMLRRGSAFFLLLAASCSSSNSSAPPPSDAGADATTSAVPEAGSDGAAPDASEDAGVCTSPDFAGNPLGVHCNQLVDTQGRTVLLHGLNARINGVFDVAFSDGRQPNEIVPAFTSDDASQIRALGFNALRLPIQWSAIEPTADGGFDDSYLDKVAAVTALCKTAGLLVLLDFHQDAYSKEIGEDGAPLWAIVPAPTALYGGPMGGTLPDGATSPDLGTRRNSAQVGAAFATFFDELDAGTPGQALRDRFTTMAAHVATRFANDPAVFGIELYNEPISSDQNLHPFYLEVIGALRAVAKNKLLLWEPSVIRNELDQASLGDGTSLGAGTVYAPHVYTDAFVGGTDFTEQSLSTSNTNARAEADSWGAPLVITEWGYGPTGARFADYVHYQQDLQDQVRASAFFWLWKESSQGNWGFFNEADGGLVQRADVVQAMARARVESVSGVLESVAFDVTAQRLEVHFTGSAAVTAPNVVSIGSGATTPAAQWKATCDGQAVTTGGVDPLQITCAGAGEHVLVVSGG